MRRSGHTGFFDPGPARESTGPDDALIDESASSKRGTNRDAANVAGPGGLEAPVKNVGQCP
jgi:hypothetical protein